MNGVDKTEIIKLHVWKNENHVKVFGIYNPLKTTLLLVYYMLQNEPSLLEISMPISML
jgi:hypothetical protein